MLHVFRHLVERDLFSIVFDWLALLDARSRSLSVGIVFETWCRPRARPPLSLCIYFPSAFPPVSKRPGQFISSNIFFPLFLGSETPLVQTASKQAGTAQTHESPCRRSYSSTPDGCAVHAALILRVLLVPDVYTHVSTAVRAVAADLGFYTSRRDRARAYVITGIHILCTT